MASPSGSPSPRKPRTDRRRIRNRRRLVDAALAICANQGTAALTVTGIARQVGMDSRGFYAHFDNVEECLKAASLELDQFLMSTLAPYENKQGRTLDESSALTATLLRTWMREPEWCRLFLRSRLEDSMIGDKCRRAFEYVLRDTTQRLLDVATQHGIRGRHLPAIEQLARLCIAHFADALTQLVQGEDDPERLAASIVRADHAIVAAEFRRLAELDRQDGERPRTAQE